MGAHIQANNLEKFSLIVRASVGSTHFSCLDDAGEKYPCLFLICFCTNKFACFITAASIQTKKMSHHIIPQPLSWCEGSLIFRRPFSQRRGPEVLWPLPREGVGLPRGVVAEISCQVLSLKPGASHC